MTLFSLSFLVLAAGVSFPVISNAATMQLENFESATVSPGVSAGNIGLQFGGLDTSRTAEIGTSTNIGATGSQSYSVATPGGAGTTFFALGEMRLADLVDLDPSNPVINFRFRFEGTSTDYVGLAIIGNNDAGGVTNPGYSTAGFARLDEDVSNSGINSFFHGVDNTADVTIDLTTYLAMIDSASTAPTYNTIRLIANKGPNTDGTYIFDDFTYNAVPEPSAVMLSMLSLGVLLRRRR